MYAYMQARATVILGKTRSSKHPREPMSSEYFLEAAGGLQSFNIAGEWYVFLSALAKVVDTSNGNISVLLGRHPGLSDGAPPVLLASRTKMQAVWPRLLQTYEGVTVKISAGGEYKRKKVRPPNNLTLYPLEVAVRIVRHYRDDVDASVVAAVEDFGTRCVQRRHCQRRRTARLNQRRFEQKRTGNTN
jgi:hypothetical protein